MNVIDAGELTLSQKLVAQWRVLYAVMLRSIRTRFGGSALGYLLAIAWPLTHIAALLAINTALGRAPPFGDSAALFFATGVIPFICFSYISRFMAFGAAMNRALLTLPIVTPMDIIFSFAILEVLSSALVVIIVLLVFVCYGIDFTPIDPLEALRALMASMLLGLGFGVIFSIFSSFFIFALTIHALIIIVLWVSSGVVFVPDAMPEVARNILYYNPVLQSIEWTRSAYYVGYGSTMLNKAYVIEWGVGMLLLGLVAERVLRGRVRML